MTAWAGRWAGVGSGQGSVVATTVGSGGSASVQGTNAATNVTLTGSADVVVTMPTDGSTLVRIIQGGSGGYTPTFKKPNGDAITWSPTDQPGWSAMAAGEAVEVRVWSVNGSYIAEWGYDIPALKSRVSVLEAVDQRFAAGYWCLAPQYGGGSVSLGLGQLRTGRWDFPEDVTFDAWGWVVSTTITLDAGKSGSVVAGFLNIGSNGKPSTVFGEFDPDTISAAATLTAGARVFGPGGSGAGFTGANTKEITIPGGTSLLFYVGITGTSGGTNNMSTVSMESGIVESRMRSTTPADIVGNSTKSWGMGTGVFTGSLGAVGSSVSTTALSGSIPRLLCRVKP